MLKKIKQFLKKRRVQVIKPLYVPVIQGAFLAGKTALVTGGTSGIGLCIATAFARCGCKTVIITGRNQERCDSTARKIEQETGAHVVGVAMNQGDCSDIFRAFSQVLLHAENKLDILCNNAGIYEGSKYENVTPEIFDSVMDINLKGCFFLSQLACAHMVEQKIEGRICNLCSSSSFRPAVNPYMLSKWGMRGLTVGLAKKLIKHGIVVNGIAPGPTATPMLMREGDSNLSHGRNPAGRYATAEEVANLAVFLVSDMGRMIVGDVVSVSGGAAITTYDDVNDYQ